MRRARRYVMRVRPDGDLRVTIPRGGSQAEARRFAERHMDWARRQRARVIEGRRPAALDSQLRAQAAETLPPQLRALAATHGFTVNRVTIRNQRSRWGSCSSRGHITLNFRLMLMPPEVREYIADITRSTREERMLALGASPRATVALFRAARAAAVLEGRNYATPDDVKGIAPAVLRHRIALSPELEVEGRSPDDVLAALLDRVKVPE